MMAKIINFFQKDKLKIKNFLFRVSPFKGREIPIQKYTKYICTL